MWKLHKDYAFFYAFNKNKSELRVKLGGAHPDAKPKYLKEAMFGGHKGLVG
jgi:hypothetical protein